MRTRVAHPEPDEPGEEPYEPIRCMTCAGKMDGLFYQSGYEALNVAVRTC